YSLKNGERAVLSTLREIKKEDYSLYVTDNSGLSGRIYESVKTATDIDSLYDKAKSKNYTHSRVRREVMNLFLKVPKELSKEKVPYMRILAVSERGISLLGKAKENSSVPVVTRHAEAEKLSEKGKEVYALQCSSTDKFALFGKEIKECSLEQKNSMQKINADI
ncbi:MAG: nucleotidyltransferase family protein, partial [Clostridia bacterium]|nr:nucleotidyltransferase family protein [Clostridia bacterium]